MFFYRMTGARHARRSAWALLMLALMWLLTAAVLPSTAHAESSVRPPSGAVMDTSPPGVSSGQARPRPSDAVKQPRETVPGQVEGTRSNSALWRALREGGRGTSSVRDPASGMLIQSAGEQWRALREGPWPTYGLWGMAGMVGLLVLFFLLRGRIRIDAGPSGETVTRFKGIERMAHWLLAVSFIVLALTGLNVLYGRDFLMPLLGKEVFATFAIYAKLLHNYVAFAFMAGLVLVFVLWVKDNIPGPRDAVWILKGGGLFVKGVHPPARKFNFGQKIIFWLVLLGGFSISLSGIALMFPFQFSLFADTFVLLNSIYSFGLPTELTPIQEMQFSAIWHAMMAVFLVCVILAHIYIGTIGMEGAFDAMGSGQVDVNWAREHHSLWYEEVKTHEAAGDDRKRTDEPAPAPAE